MKKTLILLALLIIAALFAGCATVSMEYAIDNDDNLKIAYSVSINKTDTDFEELNYYYNLKKAIKEQWEKQGLTVEIDDNDEELLITGVLEQAYDSRQEAFEGLDTILKSEYSPFTSAGFEYSSSYFEDEYNLMAKISLKDLIRRSDAQVIPSDMQDTLMKYANESQFFLTISLPGEAVETNASSQEYDNDITTNTWELKYGDEKDILLNSVLVNEENVEYHKSLTDSTNQALLITIICGGTAVLLLAVFLIIFFIKRSRSKAKNQNNKVEIPL